MEEAVKVALCNGLTYVHQRPPRQCCLWLTSYYFERGLPEALICGTANMGAFLTRLGAGEQNQQARLVSNSAHIWDIKIPYEPLEFPPNLFE